MFVSSAAVASSAFVQSSSSDMRTRANRERELVGQSCAAIRLPIGGPFQERSVKIDLFAQLSTRRRVVRPWGDIIGSTQSFLKDCYCVRSFEINEIPVPLGLKHLFGFRARWTMNSSVSSYRRSLMDPESTPPFCSLKIFVTIDSFERQARKKLGTMMQLFLKKIRKQIRIFNRSSFVCRLVLIDRLQISPKPIRCLRLRSLVVLFSTQNCAVVFFERRGDPLQILE